MSSEQSALFGQMAIIRRFEERILELFDEGVLVGTTHTSIGQEAVAAGVLAHARPGDLVFSGHRSHGHYLAFTGDADGLMAEMMGRAAGTSRGMGGSQHLAKDGFYSNGILGGIVPAAVGAAYAMRAQGETGIAFMFVGDGAFGEGVVYESLNMAALWSVPILFVVENNGYAQSTPIELNTAGTFAARFGAFGIPVDERATNDVLEVAAAASEAVDAVRAGHGPRALVVETYRLSPHSKGDDTRPPEEIELWREQDPLALAAANLDRGVVEEAYARAVSVVDAAVERALAAPAPQELPTG